MPQSEDSPEVTVYNYLTFDGARDPRLPAPFKAPRQHIESNLKGKVLEGTAEKVPVSKLDAEGRFRRRATGWGDFS